VESKESLAGEWMEMYLELSSTAIRGENQVLSTSLHPGKPISGKKLVSWLQRTLGQT